MPLSPSLPSWGRVPGSYYGDGGWGRLQARWFCRFGALSRTDTAGHGFIMLHNNCFTAGHDHKRSSVLLSLSQNPEHYPENMEGFNRSEFLGTVFESTKR